MVAPFSKLYAKICVGFCLNTGKNFFLEVSLKPTERAYVLLKNDTRDFQISPPFERSACFYVAISANFERLQYFSFKLEDRFLVESPTIDNTSFPCKTAVSEATVEINRMVSAKWTYHKERSFASDYFIFWKILFQFKNLILRVDLMQQRPKSPYLHFL